MLEIKNLSFSYLKKGQETIDDISFNLDTKQIGIVLGKNGSGKSTLFKNILGIVSPKKGEISLNNEDLTKLSKIQRAKRISYVPQEINFGSLSVYDSVLSGRLSHFGFIPSYEDEKKVNEVLEEMNLKHLALKNVNELSGGERQKVAIARALVQEPKLLIFDEPTGNLDIANEQLILKETRKLVQNKDISILISIHDLNLALDFGDKFFFLKDGKLIHEGNKEIFTKEVIKNTFGIDVEIGEINNKKVIYIEKGD